MNLLLISLTFISKFVINNNEKAQKYNEILNQLCGEDYPNYRKFNNDGLFGSLISFSIMGMYFGQIFFWYLIDKKYKINNNNYINLDGNIKKNNKNDTHTSVNDIELSDISNDEYDEDSSINTKNKENDNNNDENRIIDELINNWTNYRVYLFSPIKNIFKIILVIFISIFPGLLFIIMPKNMNLVYLFLFKVSIPFFSVLFLIYSFGFFYIIIISCGKKELLLRNMNLKFKNVSAPRKDSLIHVMLNLF